MEKCDIAAFDEEWTQEEVQDRLWARRFGLSMNLREIDIRHTSSLGDIGANSASGLSHRWAREQLSLTHSALPPRCSSSPGRLTSLLLFHNRMMELLRLTTVQGRRALAGWAHSAHQALTDD